MNDNRPLSYLVYTSTAASPFNDNQLFALLEKSRVENGRWGITGALIYKNGIFVQMIEGPDDAVEALRENIYRDPRHLGIMTLVRGVAELRVFADWTMHFVSSGERNPRDNDLAYRCLNGTGDIEEMLEASGQYRAHPDQDGLHPGLRLLLTFRQVM